MDASAHDALVAALAAAGLGRSLQRLFVDHGTTPEQVAAAMPFALDPALFYRVDSQRQPLPADVARAVAEVLTEDWQGNPTVVDVGTVNGAARLVTSAKGEYVRRPLPPLPIANPNPLFGETFQPPELQPYQVPVPAGGGVQLWSFGEVSATASWAQVDRVGDVLVDALSGGIGYGLLGSAPSAYDGRLVWTAGPSIFGPSGQFWIETLATTPAGVTAYATAATVPDSPSSACYPLAVVFEPATARIWFSDFNNGRCYRVDPVTLNADAAVLLSSGGHTYSGRGLVAVGGKLYAAGAYSPSASAEDGRLFEIDPAAAVVTRVSTGPSLGAPVGLDYDPVTEAFYVAGYPGFAHPSGNLSSVDRTSFAASTLTVTAPSGAPSTSNGFLFLTVAYGSLWVSAYDSTLWRVNMGGTILGWYQPNPSSSIFGQQVASDGQGYLWFPDGAGTLHLLSPSGSGAMTAAVEISAPAFGALAIREGIAPSLVP